MGGQYFFIGPKWGAGTFFNRKKGGGLGLFYGINWGNQDISMDTLANRCATKNVTTLKGVQTKSIFAIFAHFQYFTFKRGLNIGILAFRRFCRSWAKKLI